MFSGAVTSIVVSLFCVATLFCGISAAQSYMKQFKVVNCIEACFTVTCEYIVREFSASALQQWINW